MTNTLSSIAVEDVILSQSSTMKHHTYLEPPPQTLMCFFSNHPIASIDKNLTLKPTRIWEAKDYLIAHPYLLVWATSER